MYKMYLVSAKGYKNSKVDFLTIKTTSEIWVSINRCWKWYKRSKHI